MTSAERQQRYRAKRQATIDSLPEIPCACGCKTLIRPINKRLRPGKYAHGHNPGGECTQFRLGQVPWNKGRKAIDDPRIKGWPRETRTANALKQRTQTRLFRYNGHYTPFESQERGIAKRPSTWRINVINAIKQRDVCGPKNPFFGKRHSEDTRHKLSIALSGSNNPAWAGGIATLPYGPEFTRKFKRLIRERDSQRCQRCGMIHKKGQRALQIHHIDHNKMNNDPINLITVCASCNVWLSHHRDIAEQEFPRRRML